MSYHDPNDPAALLANLRKRRSEDDGLPGRNKARYRRTVTEDFESDVVGELADLARQMREHDVRYGSDPAPQDTAIAALAGGTSIGTIAPVAEVDLLSDLSGLTMESDDLTLEDGDTEVPGTGTEAPVEPVMPVSTQPGGDDLPDSILDTLAGEIVNGGASTYASGDSAQQVGSNLPAGIAEAAGVDEETLATRFANDGIAEPGIPSCVHPREGFRPLKPGDNLPEGGDLQVTPPSFHDVDDTTEDQRKEERQKMLAELSEEDRKLFAAFEKKMHHLSKMVDAKLVAFDAAVDASILNIEMTAVHELAKVTPDAPVIQQYDVEGIKADFAKCRARLKNSTAAGDLHRSHLGYTCKSDFTPGTETGTPFWGEDRGAACSRRNQGSVDGG